MGRKKKEIKLKEGKLSVKIGHHAIETYKLSYQQ